MSAPSPSRGPFQRTVPLAIAERERLLGGPSPLAGLIERAVRPYRLQIVAGEGGAELVGDVVGLDVGARILELAAERSAWLDETAFRACAAEGVDAALRHDLAFRLGGLRRPLRPMSLAQVAFLNDLIHGHPHLIFGVGPTGTGKTHLAVAAGLHLVAEERVKALVVTRPHVPMEGEVMTPALRAETMFDEQFASIEDELRELIGHEEIRRLTEQGKIEIAPVGRLRGRTFNESFVIIDEAQNMTIPKLRMALTRLGRNSRMVVTGDVAQIDLPEGEPSGLPHILELLDGTDLAAVHHFENRQIIRNDLVAQLEALYTRDQAAGQRLAA